MNAALSRLLGGADGPGLYNWKRLQLGGCKKTPIHIIRQTASCPALLCPSARLRYLGEDSAGAECGTILWWDIC